jgi:hypothetical protein
VGAASLVLGLTLLTRHLTSSGVWSRPEDLEHVGLGLRVLQAFFVWGWYLQKSLLPLNLSPVYPDVWQLRLADPAGWISLAAVLALTGLAGKARRAWPEALPLWGSYLALLVPTLGVFDPPFSPADRYSYLPAVPLALLVATGLTRLAAPGARTVLLGAATGIAALLAASGTEREFRHWRSPEAFFRRAIARVEPDRAAADLHWRLGLHYLTMDRIEDARAEFARTLQISPRHPDAARYLRVLDQRGKRQPDGP